MSKPIEKSLEQYHELGLEIDKLNQTRKMLRSEIEANGPYESDSWKVNITEVEREVLGDHKGIIEKYGRVALRKFLKKSKFTQMKITKKGG